MVFSSEVFLCLFLPFVLTVYYGLLRQKRNLQNLFLFGMSLIFYAYGEPWFVFVMLLSILVNWVLGLLMERFREVKSAARLLLAALLLVNLGILGYFKYWMFFLANWNQLTHSFIPIPQITLPIGISFFTFQAISYVVDVFRKKAPAQKNPLNLGLFIALFPQLIAGPIVRYETIASQIQGRRESFALFSEGVCRFVTGLGKKALIANSLARLANEAFAMPADERTAALAWLGAFAFTFQIYFDFSGYSDMAIGLGKMFGFQFPENFNYPYVSRSVSEFWRRWHISLSSFFRDYVYFPLGGSRVSTLGLIRNLFVVWLLTGLWHGANWTFICWGLFYFVLILFEKLTGFEKRFNSALFLPLKHAWTVLAFVCGWVLFRAESLPEALAYFHSMFAWQAGHFFDPYVCFQLHETRWFLLLALCFSVPLAPWLERRLEGNAWGSFALTSAYGLIFAVSLIYVIHGGYSPFLYFNF